MGTDTQQSYHIVLLVYPHQQAIGFYMALHNPSELPFKHVRTIFGRNRFISFQMADNTHKRLHKGYIVFNALEVFLNWVDLRTSFIPSLHGTHESL